MSPVSLPSPPALDQRMAFDRTQPTRKPVSTSAASATASSQRSVPSLTSSSQTTSRTTSPEVRKGLSPEHRVTMGSDLRRVVSPLAASEHGSVSAVSPGASFDQTSSGYGQPRSPTIHVNGHERNVSDMSVRQDQLLANKMFDGQDTFRTR